jgi:hypothetical protein
VLKDQINRTIVLDIPSLSRHELLRAMESGRTALEPKAYMPAEMAGTTLDEDYLPGEVKAVFNTRNKAAFLFTRARNFKADRSSPCSTLRPIHALTTSCAEARVLS